jgi:hypothetical protein
VTAALLRDALFSAAWFGLMTCVWLGWAQEGPPEKARPWLGAGSVVGILVAIGGGIQVARFWDTPTALDGRYHWFGVIVAAEVVAAGLGCLVLAKRGLQRYFASWVAIVVALHFVPLGLMLEDRSMIVLGVVQCALVVAVTAWVRRRPLTPSFPIGVAMGSTLLVYAVATAIRVAPEVF